MPPSYWTFQQISQTHPHIQWHRHTDTQLGSFLATTDAENTLAHNNAHIQVWKYTLSQTSPSKVISLSYIFIHMYTGSEIVKCSFVQMWRECLSWQQKWVSSEWVDKWLERDGGWVTMSEWMTELEGQITNCDKILQCHIFQHFNSNCGFPLNISQVSYLLSLFDHLLFCLSLYR